MNPSFESFQLKNGLLKDLSFFNLPTKLHAFSESVPVYFDNPNSTYYGFVYSGLASINLVGEVYYAARVGNYFSLSQPFSIQGGCGFVVERVGYTGMNMIGGPIEKEGRLNYIDGCKDTLLISPAVIGDPCLNALYFPKGITQTPHTHPSIRVGMVASGKGECITPWGNIPLVPGELFIIYPELAPLPCKGSKTGYAISGTHSFNTTDEPMVVIAYHPDSDFGPSHQDHPMINRTIVDGISANSIQEIQTK